MRTSRLKVKSLGFEGVNFACGGLTNEGVQFLWLCELDGCVESDSVFGTDIGDVKL